MFQKIEFKETFKAALQTGASKAPVQKFFY
jgi:hypothetical protein